MKNTNFHADFVTMANKLYAEDKGLPARFVFVLTLKCNLRCPFCMQDHLHPKQEMHTRDWLQVLEQMPDYARVTLTGGEPLLYPGFKEIFLRAAQQHDVNVICNGTLLNKEWIDLFLSVPGFKVLSLSIDTFENSNRGYTSQQWRRMLDGIEYFRARREETEHGAVLDVKTVVCEESATSLYELFVYCRDVLRVDTQAFQFLKGSPIQHASDMSPLGETFEPVKAPVLSPAAFAEAERQLESIRSVLANSGMRVFLHPPLVEFSATAALPENFAEIYNSVGHDSACFAPCIFPWSSMHINADGNAFPCQAISMGNVKERTLSEIVSGDVARSFRDAVRTMGTTQACNRCGWLRPRAF